MKIPTGDFNFNVIPYNWGCFVGFTGGKKSHLQSRPGLFLKYVFEIFTPNLRDMIQCAHDFFQMGWFNSKGKCAYP